ncbi:glycosyltransferase family 1 protein [Fulvimarina sp. MAC3]|uniref:glycosyltransferase family 4 protein n=1 Tax=Fulvimarina sp. MAC3 TaxID=3148887 RepID=UPI0031FE0C14
MSRRGGPTISRESLHIGIDARNLTVQQSGIGRYLVETTRHLVRQGCAVTLYLPQPPHHSSPSIDGARLVVSNYRSPPARMFWGQTVLPRQVASDGVDVFWGPAHRLPARLAAPIPKVLTVLDLVWIHAARTMRRRTYMGERFFMGPAVRAADAIVTISEATARDLLARYELPHDRVETIYPGAAALVEGRDPNLLRRLGLEGGYALFVGTLEPRKNLPRLIDAYSRLEPALRSRCRLALAGGRGWRQQDLADLAARAGLSSGEVIPVGYLNEGELGQLYAHARFIAMPSLYEGFGLPIVEANAFGVPVLTSDRSSMPEVAGRAGRLVNPFDANDIARGFRELVEDNELHATLAAAARENARRFDWGRSTARIVELFERVVAERRQA